MGLKEDIARERADIVAAESKGARDTWGRVIDGNRKVAPTEPIELAVAESQKPGVVNRDEYCNSCVMDRPFYSIGPLVEMNGRDVRPYNCLYCDTTMNFAE